MSKINELELELDAWVVIVPGQKMHYKRNVEKQV